MCYLDFTSLEDLFMASCNGYYLLIMLNLSNQQVWCNLHTTLLIFGGVLFSVTDIDSIHLHLEGGYKILFRLLNPFFCTIIRMNSSYLCTGLYCYSKRDYFKESVVFFQFYFNNFSCIFVGVGSPQWMASNLQTPAQRTGASKSLQVF